MHTNSLLTLLRSKWTIKILLLALFAANPGLAAEKAELQRHTVMADGHPVALWEKSAVRATEAILLVHGRTWSALPDFDLQVEGAQTVAPMS